jgi:hypothetical protein
MLGIWTDVLAQDDGHGTGTIFYVIAVLILSGLGALAEKLKQKKQESKRHWKPTKIEGPPRPARRAPPRPAQPAARREPAAPGSAPPARPVPRKAVVPRPPAPARPHPQVLTERQMQPTVRQQKGKRRPAPGQRRARRPTRKPTQDLVAQLEQRAEAALREGQPIEAGLAEQLSPADRTAARRRARPGLFTPARSMNRMSIRELRNAIVLSEVLQPPLALRDLQ